MTTRVRKLLRVVKQQQFQRRDWGGASEEGLSLFFVGFVQKPSNFAKRRGRSGVEPKACLELCATIRKLVPISSATRALPQRRPLHLCSP